VELGSRFGKSVLNEKTAAGVSAVIAEREGETYYRKAWFNETSTSSGLARMKIIKPVAALAAIALIVVQFFRVDQSNPAVTSDLNTPPEVKAILKRACYDCHSNETRWPWYTHVAPVSWLMAYDVHEGRHSLNYSNWGKLDEGVRVRLLRLTQRDVNNTRMPPWFYVYPMHLDARLSADNRSRISDWAEAERVELIRKYEAEHHASDQQ
jgi:Haem-binding domain